MTTEKTPSEKLLLTPPEAADRLSISERTLWTNTAPRGPVPCVRIGRSVRYYVADLADFGERGRTAPAAGGSHPEVLAC